MTDPTPTHDDAHHPGGDTAPGQRSAGRTGQGDVGASRDPRPSAEDPTGTGPVIRDRRKVDPVTGKARKSASSSLTGASTGKGGTSSSTGQSPADRLDEAIDIAGTPPSAEQLEGDAVIAAAEVIAARAELAERTDDLLRLQADYANYRKRVDRDRALAGDLGRGEVLAALISTLDDIDAARAAGELTGPFAAVAEKLEATVERFGMERYGEVGEPFDPTIHEAMIHEISPDANDGPRLSLVIQPGYRVAERVLRAARVGVIDAG